MTRNPVLKPKPEYATGVGKNNLIFCARRIYGAKMLDLQATTRQRVL